jgi:hypothetical protein
MELYGVKNLADLQQQHRHWVDQELKRGVRKRDENWTSSIAVGSESFVKTMYGALGIKVKDRSVTEEDGKFVLRESPASYRVNFALGIDALRVENTAKWEI